MGEEPLELVLVHVRVVAAVDGRSIELAPSHVELKLVLGLDGVLECGMTRQVHVHHRHTVFMPVENGGEPRE